MKKKRVKVKLQPSKARVRRPLDAAYIDPYQTESFSDSDLFAWQGVTVKTSNNESREETGFLTLAQREELEDLGVEEPRASDLIFKFQYKKTKEPSVHARPLA